MKKQKLELSKKTISVLDQNELNKLKGGAFTDTGEEDVVLAFSRMSGCCTNDCTAITIAASQAGGKNC